MCSFLDSFSGAYLQNLFGRLYVSNCLSAKEENWINQVKYPAKQIVQASHDNIVAFLPISLKFT